MNMKRVLYPGTFDPVHNGHLEIVDFAARHFDEVIVAAMRNPQKGEPLFSYEERHDMLEECFVDLPNVRVTMFAELVVELAKKEKTNLIIKGLRAVSDFESELQMAQTNKTISGVETIFIPSTSSSSFIASKLIREIAFFGGDVSSMVPGNVNKHLLEARKASKN